MLTDTVEAACAGNGSMVLLEGPSGIGKSRLLQAVTELGSEQGALVLTTSGGELEREYPFGLVRRMLESRVARCSAAEREHLFRGYARAAEDLLRPSVHGVGSAVADEFPLVHSLYWLLANLAEDQPVVVVADDLQWADELSLRFLHYLSQRLAELPVILVGAVRTGDPAAESELVLRLTAQANTVIRLSELSVEAVRELLGTLLPERVGDEELVSSCWSLTRGNPFLLHELTSSISAGGAIPTSDLSAADPGSAAPESVGVNVMLRLSRLGESAVALARAVAVLGPGGTPDDACRVAGISYAEAAEAAERLRAAQILTEGPDLGFHHPVIRTAVYLKFPSRERTEAHALAAQLLHDRGADLEQVAMHLVRGTPTGEPWARTALQYAARGAGRKGAPAIAVAYLRRALTMPVTDPHANAELLVDLGLMEAAAGEQSSLVHLELALQLLDDPRARGEALYALGQTLFRYGRPAEALPLFRRGADELSGIDRDLALRLEAGYMASAAYLIDRAPDAHARLTELAGTFGEPDTLSPPERLLALQLAVFRAMSVPGCGDHVALIRSALGDGVQLWRDTSDGMTISHVILALTWCGAPSLAAATAERVLEEARERGDALIYAEVRLGRCLAMYALGRIGEAMADAQSAIEGMQRGWSSTVPAPQGVLAYCHLDRGELDEADKLLRDTELQLREGEVRLLNVWFYMARGRLRLARSEAAEARNDFLHVGSLLETNGYANPGFMLAPWRSHAGLAAAALGRNEEAAELIDADIAAAREFGARTALGAALRSRALISPSGPDVELLSESAEILDDEEASILELAMTLTELGAALRRGGQRVRSREPLRRALDLAHHAGASAVEAQAHAELLAGGARPRRAVLRGADALTPSEQRIAAHIADGLTSRRIAESLYLTLNTVEWHRRNIYRKLQVASRDELRAALAHDDTSDPTHG